MAEDSQHAHTEDIYSDLDVLVEMAKDSKKDEQAIERHLESLKAKIEKLIHRQGSHSGGSST